MLRLIERIIWILIHIFVLLSQIRSTELRKKVILIRDRGVVLFGECGECGFQPVVIQDW